MIFRVILVVHKGIYVVFLVNINFIIPCNSMVDLEKFGDKRKESLFQTIGSTFWRGLEDLGKAMAGSKKTSANGKPILSSTDQISPELDKFESERMKK